MKTLAMKTLLSMVKARGLSRGMMARAAVVAGLTLVAAGAMGARQAATQPASPSKPASKATTKPQPVSMPALRYKLQRVDGKEIDLMAFHGRAVMIVPVAWDSNRRQFEDLELFARFFKDRGFDLIVVITDSFGAESRSDAELIKAVEDRYRTQSLLFASRVKVKGPDAHPLFKYLATTEGGEIAGPFTKFLISRDGEVVKRWEPKERLVEGNGFPEVLNATDTPMKEVGGEGGGKKEKKEAVEGDDK